jgi:Tannase and feruloyl esterase
VGRAGIFDRDSAAVIATIGSHGTRLTGLAEVHPEPFRQLLRPGSRARRFPAARQRPIFAHCGGDHGPDSFNGLGALVDWVENGQAPASLITSKVGNGTVTETRPVYQYPLIAVDTTGGPITEASSYLDRHREKVFLARPSAVTFRMSGSPYR